MVDKWDMVHVLVLVFILMYLVVINKVYKRKTSVASIVALQVLIPISFITVTYVILEDLMWTLVILSIVILLCLIFNYTEIWFRQYYEFDGEHVVIINTLNNAPDSDTLNVYKPKFHDIYELDKLFQQNWDIITRIKGVEPFKEMIQHYYMMHPEAIDLIAATKEIHDQQNEITTQTKPKSKSKTKQSETEIPDKPAKETDQDALNARIDEIRTESLLVFREIFRSFHFHVRYMRWFFFLGVDSEMDLHNRLKVYVLSLKANLPTVMNLNCVFLMDEIENGKKFTSMMALEGYRVQATIDKLTNLSNDLECLKFFPKFSELDRLQKRAEYWEKTAYSLLDEFTTLGKHDLTIAQKIANATPKLKKKSIFSRGKGNGE